MSLEFLNTVRDDLKYILNSDFGLDLILTPDGGEDIVVVGHSSVHSMSFDSDGNPFISDNAHCTFVEKDVTDQGVSTRNANGDVNIKGWKVEFDVSGTVRKFVISEHMPDSGLGIILAKLTYYDG